MKYNETRNTKHGARNLFSLLCLLTLGTCHLALAVVNIEVDTKSITGRALTNMDVTLTWLGDPSNNGSAGISLEPEIQATGTNGSTTFTNLQLFGNYRIDFASTPRTSFKIAVTTNLSGTYSAFALRTTSNSPAVSPQYLTTETGTALFYTQSQVDDLIAGIDTGGSGGAIISSNDNTILVTATEVTSGVTNFSLAANMAVLATDSDLLDGTNKVRIGYQAADSTESAARIAGDASTLASALTSVANTNTATLASALTFTGAASNALAVASGLDNSGTLFASQNTNLLYFYGVNTNAADKLTQTWNPVMQAWTNPPAAQRRATYIGPNGHGLHTNISGLLLSNTVVGVSGSQTWTNLSFPSNVLASAEFLLTLVTNPPALTNVLATNNYGLFGWCFMESTNFLDATNGTVTPGLFPLTSTDHGATWRAGTVPKYFGGAVYGARDPFQTENINGYYGLLTTTNELALPSSAFNLKLGPTLSTMQDYTNVNMLMDGETISSPTNYFHWSPKVLWIKELNYGILYCSVATNWWQATNTAPIGFEIRMRTFTDLHGPYSSTIRLNQTRSSNLVDMVMFWNKTNIIAAVKNQASGYMEIGSFATTNPASPFTFALTDDFNFWGGGLEGWMWDQWTDQSVTYTAGSTIAFLGPTRGNKGDAFIRMRAITTNSPLVGFSWSAMTNVVNPKDPTGRGYAQNFNPVRLTTPAEQAEASMLVEAASVPKGWVEAVPSGPPITNKFVKWAWPYNESSAFPMPGYSARWGIGQQGILFTSEGESILTVLKPDGATNRAIVANSNTVAIPSGFNLTASSPASFVNATNTGNLTLNTNSSSSGVALTVNGSLSIGGQVNLNNNAIANGGAVNLSPNGSANAFSFQTTGLTPSVARVIPIGSKALPFDSFYGTAFIYSSNALTMAQAAGLVTNGGYAILPISNYLYSVKWTNGVPAFWCFTNLAGFP